MSDEALIYAIARGDREALALLYDRQASLLLGLGARILSKAADSREAEDVLHDVFVEVWKRAGDFDPSRASARTWLCLRMRSRCLDRVRSAKRRKAAPIEDGITDGVAQRAGFALDGAGDDLSAGLDASRVRHAMEGLPHPQREVLLLGYFQGLSSQEIADTLHIPLGTVKSRVAAALSHLRSMLSVRPPVEGVAP